MVIQTASYFWHRVDPAPADGGIVGVRPTLIIGAGGTGREVATRLKKRFKDEFGSPERYPIVGYFLIDTDSTAGHYTPSLKELETSFRFERNEMVTATVSGVDQFITNLEQPAYAHLKKWIYPNLSGLVDMLNGASTFRPYGRLGFVLSEPTIRSRLTAVFDQIRDVGHRLPMSKEHKVTVAPGVEVWVIASLAGGTGSSIFLDIAFMMKEIAEQRGISLESKGLLLMPSFYMEQEVERHEANAYAALKELEYYSLNDWVMEYASGGEHKVTPPPFNHCYLLDNTNDGGFVLQGNEQGRHELFEMLADYIFLDFTNVPFSSRRKSQRAGFVGIMNQPYAPQVESLGKAIWSKGYMGLGYSSISVPRPRIINACAYKLAADVVSAWGALSRVRTPLIESVVANAVYNPENATTCLLGAINFFESLSQEGQHDLLSWLSRLAGGERIPDEIERWADEIQRNVLGDVHLREGIAGKTVEEYLEDEFKRFEARFVNEKDTDLPERWGTHTNLMRTNKETFLSGGQGADGNFVPGVLDKSPNQRGRLYQEIAKRVNRRELGAGHAVQMLQELKRRLTTGADSYETALTDALGDENAEKGLYHDRKVLRETIDKDKQTLEVLLAEREKHEREVMAELEKHENWAAPAALWWMGVNKRAALQYDREKLESYLEQDRKKLADALDEYTYHVKNYFNTRTRIYARVLALEVCDKVAEYIDHLILEIGRIADTLNLLHRNMVAQYMFYRAKEVNVLFPNVFDENEIENVYYQRGTITTGLDGHSNAIQAALARFYPDANHPSVQIMELPELIRRFGRDKVEGVLREYAVSCFERAIGTEVDIIQKINQLPPDEQQHLLSQALSASQPWIRLNPAGRAQGFAVVPGENKRLMVGRYNDPAMSAIYDEFDRHLSASLDPTMAPALNTIDSPDQSRVLICTELAGYPICAYALIGNLKTTYETLLAKGEDAQRRGAWLHIDHNEYKFEDLIPTFDPVEQNEIKQAIKAFVLGLVLGVLDVEVRKGEVNYIFPKPRPFSNKTDPVDLGIETRAKIRLRKEKDILKAVEERIAEYKGKIMQQQHGQYGPSFDNYCLTLTWCSENTYPVRLIQLPGAGGGSRPQQSVENRILDEEKEKMGEAKDKELERYARDQGTDVKDEKAVWQTQMDSSSGQPDNFSIPFPNAPNLRKVKM